MATIVEKAPAAEAGRSSLTLVDRRVVWIIVAVATAAAAALRLPFLSHQSLWFDEIYTRTILGRHTLVGIWNQVHATESTPPLYYVIAKLATDIVGARSAAAMRAPSAIALILAVPVSYLAFRRFIGERCALAVAAVVAVNPLLVNYSTDARSYGLLVLTALLSVWAFSTVLADGRQRAYAVWALACVACVWTHYFGAFTIAAEALLLLWLRRANWRATIGWTLVIVAGAAPLVPLLMHQNASEDAAFIAGISLASRLETTVRQFSLGPNVLRAWLEAAGLLVLVPATALGSLAALRHLRGRIVLTLTLFTVALPLLIGIAGIEDRFYARNVIVAVPLVAALAAPALLRLRAAPLALYLALAVLTSVWVSTNWRYEQFDWRSAIAQAHRIDASAPIVAVGADDTGVASTYLGRAPARGVVPAARVLLIVQPYRGPGDRALVPAPVSASLTGRLHGFTPQSTAIVHGFRLILLAAPRSVPLSAAQLPGATLFAPPR